jgi:two-component system phosphate regulon sensor histidine kinase PhoR
LTGQGITSDSINSAYLLGGNEYWIKTMSPRELVARVHAILKIADLEKNYRALQQSFYSTVVNDLRTPIGTILDASEYLLVDRGSLDRDHVATVSEIINTAAVHLLQIVKDMLNLTNLESGEYIIQRKTISLPDMIDTVLEKMNDTRKQKNIDVKVDIEKSLALSADDEHFQELLENLFDNALRFTPPNGKIYCSAKHCPAKNPNEKDSVVIEISDTGCGIIDEDIPSLFDKSRITDAQFRKSNARTGLGLVICREIVEAHDGTIAVESKVGEGSKFIITLPAY